MAVLVLALLLFASMPHASAFRADVVEEGKSITVQARTTVLVEEMTATWCATCADIDPYLAEVADRHGSRLALVGLHPLDGQDGVATAASEARLDRWRAVHDNLNQTPAFLVEGEAPLIFFYGGSYSVSTLAPLGQSRLKGLFRRPRLVEG